MAGWGNDSFDAGAAGGWGDVSYAGQETVSEGSRANDKIPLPVSITDLNHHVNTNDEKITFGKATFSTVRIVGVVKSVVEQDGGQSIEYKIGDADDSPEDFLVIHYKGVPNDSTTMSDTLVEGTTAAVVGKLRNFDNRFAIVAFDVREVENQHELEAFRLEAALAKLYYAKDIGERIKSNPSQFENTLFRGTVGTGTSSGSTGGTGAPTASGWGGNVGQTMNASSVGTAQPVIKSAVAGNAKGLEGQRAEIYSYLSTLKSDEGTNLEDIRHHVPKHIYNPLSFMNDIDALLSEGHIYSTCDDDHYAAN